MTLTPCTFPTPEESHSWLWRRVLDQHLLMLMLDMWYNQDSPGSQPPPAWSACLLVIWLSHFQALSLDFLRREEKGPGDEASLKAVLRAGHTQLIRD